MAILKFADADVQIQVECGKKILHEYSRKTQGDKQECWIASKEDTVSPRAYLDVIALDPNGSHRFRSRSSQSPAGGVMLLNTLKLGWMYM